MLFETKFERKQSYEILLVCLIDTKRFASFLVIGKNLSIVHLDLRNTLVTT